MAKSVIVVPTGKSAEQMFDWHEIAEVVDEETLPSPEILTDKCFEVPVWAVEVDVAGATVVGKASVAATE